MALSKTNIIEKMREKTRAVSPMSSGPKAEIVSLPKVVVSFPQYEPMARGMKSRFRSERQPLDGHKRRRAYQVYFRCGAGAHDPLYKDVRRGKARS